MHLEVTKYAHSISWIFLNKSNNAKIYILLFSEKNGVENR